MFFRQLKNIFFAKISATGFGLMRIFWGLTVLLYYIPKLSDVARYFSSSGVFPLSVEPLALRSVYRFTILDGITEPHAVIFLYVLMLLAALCMVIGVLPRITTIVAVLLLFSFHERNPFPFGGGDTVLRNVGFFLMIAPCLAAFSLGRLERQWGHWKRERELLPPLTMARWPRHLLTAQLLVIYLSSAWFKFLGPTWWSGTAVAIVLHHAEFARFPGAFADLLSPLSAPLGYGVLLWELAWLPLLIPRPLFDTGFIASKAGYTRMLLLVGVVMHVAIFILFDVGSFSLAMLTAYLGLLDEHDFDAMRQWFNRRRTGKRTDALTNRRINVLYDGHCGLCQRSTFTLMVLDHLHRLNPIDFHDVAERERVAPDLNLNDLNRAMHIRFATKNESTNKRTNELKPFGKTLAGFDAIRAITWNIPALWPLAPLLSIPGIPIIGRRIYARIAERRRRCTHENCTRWDLS